MDYFKIITSSVLPCFVRAGTEFSLVQENICMVTNAHAVFSGLLLTGMKRISHFPIKL